MDILEINFIFKIFGIFGIFGISENKIYF